MGKRPIFPVRPCDGILATELRPWNSDARHESVMPATCKTPSALARELTRSLTTIVTHFREKFRSAGKSPQRRRYSEPGSVGNCRGSQRRCWLHAGSTTFRIVDAPDSARGPLNGGSAKGQRRPANAVSFASARLSCHCAASSARSGQSSCRPRPTLAVCDLTIECTLT